MSFLFLKFFVNCMGSKHGTFPYFDLVDPKGMLFYDTKFSILKRRARRRLEHRSAIT